MTTPGGSDKFYGSIPVFRGFGSLMEPSLYSPLPDDWSIGIADIVESTKAIAQARYNAVNMAGDSAIAAANLSVAVFSGGGLGWAEAGMKGGEFKVEGAPSGTEADLTGLSCRFGEIPGGRRLILSVLVVPARGADPAAFRKVIEDIIALVERSPDAGRPVPPGGPPLRWPPAGLDYEAPPHPGRPPFTRRPFALANPLFPHSPIR